MVVKAYLTFDGKPEEDAASEESVDEARVLGKGHWN